MIANNPVAGARFFKVMTEAFIKHVLGYKNNSPGLYGKTAGYYRTVEQQGRLTLHMHMLVWIKHALTPQEVRDKILDSESDFQQRMVEYLEAAHIGEFMNKTMTEVTSELEALNIKSPHRELPTTTLPESAPVVNCTCKIEHFCDICKKSEP